MADSVYDFEAQSIDGKTQSLSEYQGKVLLIVNTASRCGFTPQYAGLQSLYETYRQQGLEILGFPCNQFGAQEPGSETDIAEFCQVNYGVAFPLFAKIDVNGDQAHPLYRYLKKTLPGVLGSANIKWNFTKFLVDQKGLPIDRFSPQTKPEALDRIIKKQLSQS